jgi:general secretion pathway protein K
MRSARSEPGEQGFALMLVLWALLLAAVLAGSLLLEARTSRTVAATGTERLRDRLIADGAINRAIMALLDTRDPLRLSLDGTAQSIRLFGKDVALRAESEAGKVNLNAAPPKLLAAMFEGQGVPSAEASALAARVVIGMTDALQAAIAPLSTIWSGDAFVDRSVAGEDVLRMLEASGDSLAASQRAARKAGQAAGANRPAAVGEAVTITATLEATDFALSRIAVIQLAGNRQEPYRVLAWH